MGGEQGKDQAVIDAADLDSPAGALAAGALVHPEPGGADEVGQKFESGGTAKEAEAPGQFAAGVRRRREGGSGARFGDDPFGDPGRPADQRFAVEHGAQRLGVGNRGCEEVESLDEGQAADAGRAGSPAGLEPGDALMDTGVTFCGTGMVWREPRTRSIRGQLVTFDEGQEAVAARAGRDDDPMKYGAGRVLDGEEVSDSGGVDFTERPQACELGEVRGIGPGAGRRQDRPVGMVEARCVAAPAQRGA